MKKRLIPGVITLILVISFTFAACSQSGGADGSASGGGNSGQPVFTDTTHGRIEGLTIGNLDVYKGIPYAKPPTGDLRFAPPEDAEPWADTLKCTDYSKIAVQASPQENFEMSEDCLTLNVWSPAKEGEKLPVYVWIHGGGYAQGSGAYSLYDGTSFAEKGIVMVTINYRLNGLGFFASQHTYDEYGTTGNWGLLDQIKALEWIQNNIEAFGGDPDKVTIGGESAGSYSVSALILSPLAKGLFSGAIMESGTILAGPGNNYYGKGNLERCIELSNMMAYTFGAEDNAEGLAKLRAADAEVFAQLSPLDLNFIRTSAFLMQPVFDGYVMPKDPFAALENGDFNKVKLLWGYNGNEGSIFVPGDINEARYEMLASRMFGYDYAQEILKCFPVDENNSAGSRGREILAYGMFDAVMKPYGDAFAENGMDVYAYRFNYATEKDIEQGLGASHGSEIAYTFGNVPSPDAEQKKVQEEMQTRWVNFIKNGDPNVGEKVNVEWPKYTASKNEMLMFEKEVSVGSMPKKDDIDFMLGIMTGGAYFK